MDKPSVAWAAGLFEGEGSIVNVQLRHHRQVQIRLSVEMADKDVLERFFGIVGCGSIKGPRLYGGQKRPTWRWQVGNRSDAERLLIAFFPWLGSRRRARAAEALAEIRKLDRACEECGKPFRAYRSDQRFCSPRHRERAWHRKNKQAVFG